MDDLRNMPHNQLRKVMALKAAIGNLEKLQSQYCPIFDDDPVLVNVLQTMKTECDRLMDEVRSREDAMNILEDVLKELSMELINYPRFINAIEEAIAGLELEARCYGYTEDPAHVELLQAYKAEMEKKEKRDHYIWKAKHQRGLTDEEIQYFLDNHPKWEYLPHYARFVKKYGKEEALAEVLKLYGDDRKDFQQRLLKALFGDDETRVMYFGCVHFIATSSACEECEREDLTADKPQVCDVCGQPIKVGSEAVRLINLEDGASPEDKEYYLHRDCADRSCLRYQDYVDEMEACW